MEGRIGIVGAGVMGRSIALQVLQSGLAAVLFDVEPAAGVAAADWITARCGVADRLMLAAARDELADVDVLIEAVVENRAVKRRVLGSLSALAPGALLATNTSSLSIAELAESIREPQRFCGLHFCHPVAACPLVEVIPGPATSDRTRDRAVDVVRRLNLQPLVTRDVPGFAVNRLLFPYLDAAVALVRGGVEWERIERTAVEFGMRQGPLSQMDEIGIDVILRAAAAFHRGNPVIPPQSELLLAMYQAGRRGVKSGRGFFSYACDGARGAVDPGAHALVAAHLTAPIACTDAELQLRLFVPMLAAACELLEQQIVADVAGVRAALTGGLGCRGQAADLPGWARQIPQRELAQSLERLGLPAVMVSRLR